MNQDFENPPPLMFTADMAQELGRMQSEVNRKDHIIQTLCGEITGHMQAYSLLYNQREALHQRIRDMQTEISQAQTLSNSSMAEKEQLAEKLDEKEKEIQQLQSELQWFKRECYEQGKHKGSIISQHEDLEQRYKHQQVRLRCVERELWRLSQRDREQREPMIEAINDLEPEEDPEEEEGNSMAVSQASHHNHPYP